MGIYEYECPNGHKTEIFVKITERPVSLECRCGELAKYVISAVPTTFRQMDRHAFKRSGR